MQISPPRSPKRSALCQESWGLANPAWKLDIGKTYLVDVHVIWSNAKCNETFKLEYLSHDFGEFRLQAVK